MQRLALLGIVLTLSFHPLYSQIAPGLDMNLVALNPSPFIGDWESSPGVAMMTVQNSGLMLDVGVTATLWKDGTRIGSAPSNITSIKTGMSVYQSPQIARWGEFTFVPAIQNILTKTGRLPEGSYELNVKIAQSAGPASAGLSDSAQIMFYLSYPQPPQLITPADGSEINFPNPTFQWTPVVMTGKIKVRYRFKIVEIIKGQTSKQAISANVPHYEENISAMTMKLYPPSALPLEKGKQYAWQVQALGYEADKPAEIIIGANDGKSEIWTFTYPNVQVFMPVQPKPPAKPPSKQPETKPPAQYQCPFNTYINGKIVYFFPSITGWAIPSSQSFPLKNTSVKFVQKLAILEKSSGKMVVIPSTVWDKVLAVTTTNENGDYVMPCMMTDSMKLLFKNRTWTINGSSVFGDLYRVGRIEIDNPYYCNPDDEINVQPGQSKTLPPMAAKARSYVLSLKVMPNSYEQKAQYVSGPMSGIIVYLMRKTHPADAPDMEGHKRPVPKEMRYGMEVISKDTTSSAGLINFVYLAKNIGPNDTYYIDAEPDPKGDKFYFFWGPVEYKFNYTADKAVYSGSYHTAMDFKTIYMNPCLPKVQGAIYRADNLNKPVGGAVVKILKYGDMLWDIEQSMTSLSDGTFKFLNLHPEYDNNGSIIGPGRGMYISKYGFRDTILQINNAAPLKLGQQVPMGKILLQPAAYVHGTVVNENGYGVNAFVTVGSSATVNASHGTVKKKNSMGDVYFEATPAVFECPSVLGLQRIIIDPTDKSYFTDTVWVTITQANQELEPIILKKKLQRIQVQVFPEVVQQTLFPAKGLKGAIVRIQNINPVIGSQTNDYGLAEFKFTSSGNTFSVNIIPPAGLDFEGKTVSVSAPPSKDWTVVTVHLKKAARINGRVFVGKDSPVDGAKVFLDQSGSSTTTETKTDAAGNYKLRNVPFGKHTLRAVKGGNFIGDSVRVNITDAGIYIDSYATIFQKKPKVDSVNFHLKVYDDMDITKLLGFPIEVTKLVKSGTVVKISGIFSQLASNTYFSPDTNFSSMPMFNDIVIRPGLEKNSNGVPVAEPKGGVVLTDRNFIDLTVYQKLLGRSEDKTGLKIVGGGSGTGMITGKVFLSANSFSDPNIKFAGSGFYLALPTIADPAARMRIPTIIADGNLPLDVPDGFLAVNQSGGPVQYELFGPGGFIVKADSAKSYLKDDAVRLASRLYVDLQNVTPSKIDFDIGDVVLHTDKLDPVKGTKKISIPLEQWSLESEDWTISKSGGFILDGVLKTGKVEVPFAALEIKPTQFVSTASTFKLNEMTLSGIIPLTITGDPYFGYDPGQKHWALSIAPKQGESYCSYFSNLPGMNAGEKIQINNFFMLSNGSDGFAIDPNTQPLTFYNVATFKPTMMNVYSTYIHIPGTMDVHIPDVSVQSSAVDFKKDSQGNLAMTFQPFPFGFTTNGVSLTFLANGEYPETLDKNGFTCRGTVEEAGKFKFNAMLYKTADTVSLWIEPNQELNITATGSSKFTKIAGSMRVENGSWTNLWFDGDLTGAEGATGRIKFTVIGDVVADQQEVGVQNIPSPFGNITLIYDFENHRLEGMVDFTNGIDLGGATASGSADLLFDSEGWYFVAGATLAFEGIKGQAAMVFGNYPVVPAITERFKQYSWVYQNKGAFPSSFPTYVKGFFMEGEAQIPVLIPDFEFDFLLISGGLYVHVGADMRLGMNFYETASFSYGQTVFGEAGISIGGSIGVACAGVSASVLVDAGFDGTLYRNGDYLITGDIGLNLCGSAYCGWGVCNSKCGGKFCDKSEESGCKGIGVKCKVSNSDKSIKFYLK